MVVAGSLDNSTFFRAHHADAGQTKGGFMSAFRPLPPRPSLEYEHKEAKALLRRLHAGDPDSIARAQARLTDVGDPANLQLADAQLTIAREYGFASWPKLVRYFQDMERQHRSWHDSGPSGKRFWESWVQGMLAEFKDHRVWVARALAAYVPRFYGMRVEDVFAQSVDENDMRLAAARGRGFPSWEVALEHSGRERVAWDEDAIALASRAIESADLEALKRVTDKYPHLLRPTPGDVARGFSLMSMAVFAEQRAGQSAIHPIMLWLTEHGFDRQRTLNLKLCGHIAMSPDEVHQLLDLGADPHWIAPNGISVLEHALIRYRNGAAVDLIAARAKPRRAFWIAAGLGDVNEVRKYYDSAGRVTPEARRHRPEFDAVGPMMGAQNPDPDDEEILFEAFLIAVLNGRIEVLDYMCSQGFPVNTLIWGSPIIVMAAADRMVSVVECLVRHGADLDLRGWRPEQSARESIREMLEHHPDNADYRHIAELFGLDVTAILAERDARPTPQPLAVAALQSALEFAGDDAFRMGQPEIRPENLFFGLLRDGRQILSILTTAVRMDSERFKADARARVRPEEKSPERPKLVLDGDAQQMMRDAIARATEKQSNIVQPTHLLYALTRSENGFVAEYLARYGTSAAVVNALLEKQWV
jgi:hypothetical protein